MWLEGSCHCQSVRFRVRAPHPVPYQRCYCSICRKTAGSGGFAVNVGAEHATLEVKGREHLGVYRARLHDRAAPGEEPPRSEAERHFCRACGSPLWLWDPRWPELVHPHASAIDTRLPVPPERVHMMLGSKAAWVEPDLRDVDRTFDEYPEESLAAWHARLHLGAP